MICHEAGTSHIPAVYSLRQETYQEVFNWLRMQHYEKIGLIFGRSAQVSATAATTMAAYRAVFGKQPATETIQIGAVTFADGYQTADYFCKYPVDAILTSGDDIAAGLHEYFVEHQITEPFLIGQDRQLSGQLLKIATIDHHINQVGALAAELLISGERKSISIPSEFLFAENR